RHRPRFERAVVEVVRTAFAHRLRVGVRQLGLADEHLTANGPNGSELAVLACSDGAVHTQPLADVAVLAHALPHFRSWPIDRDLHRDGDIGRIGDHDTYR